ncbi:unnamed protein product [Pleuronectes platessa]|uniref:Uncharacterized protein n=1 Tax=Pleuronectes platessa TaxID=8262 RepID=A0A9N7YWK6_PLEPL|nr:unnamed protein product [Pleuronectes platessa]
MAHCPSPSATRVSAPALSRRSAPGQGGVAAQHTHSGPGAPPPLICSERRTVRSELVPVKTPVSDKQDTVFKNQTGVRGTRSTSASFESRESSLANYSQLGQPLSLVHLEVL